MWLFYSISAFFLSGIFTIFIAITLKRGISSETLLFWISIIRLIGFGTRIFFTNKGFMIETKSILLVICVGIIGLITNILIFNAYKISPNTAVSQTIIGANTIIVLVIGMLFLKENINIVQVLGIFLTLIGLSIVILFK